MSFILDALKKSESDRQRQSGPSLFEVKIAPPRRALPVWAIAIAVLLGINVIVISWMLLRHPASQQPATASSAPATAPISTATASDSAGAGARNGSEAAIAGAPAVPAAAARASDKGESPAAPPALGRAPGQGQSASAPPALDRAPGQGQSASAPAALAAAPGQGQPSSGSSLDSGADHSPDQAPGGDPNDYAPAVAPAASTSGPAEAAGDLPLYQQIVSSSGLPALHLDLHVFADRPQDRFVMINMHRLGEGDSLPSGVQVDAIRPDGVVLSYRGTRFLLPRN